MAKARLLILLPGHQLLGQERALIGLARILRAYGVDSYFLLHGRWGRMTIATHLERQGFPFAMLPLGTLWSLSMAIREPGILVGNLWAVIKTTLAFRQLMKREHFSHVILGNSTFALYLLPGLFFTKTPVIYRHGDEMPDHSAFHRATTRILFRRVDRHVANCQYLKSRLATRSPSINPVIIYNTPWGEKSSQSANEATTLCKSAARRQRILYIGQLSEHKGILHLLEAFRILAPEYPALVLDIVGESPGVGKSRDDTILSKLQRTMKDFPERVFLHGFQNDVGRYYQSACIHVCPSVWQEPSPNVVLEAKQYGLPSVVFNVGGVSELIVHKEDGFVCEKVSANDLGVGIKYFLGNKSVCRQAGEAALKSIDDRFSQQRFGAQWMDVLLSSRKEHVDA